MFKSGDYFSRCHISAVSIDEKPAEHGKAMGVGW